MCHPVSLSDLLFILAPGVYPIVLRLSIKRTENWTSLDRNVETVRQRSYLQGLLILVRSDRLEIISQFKEGVAYGSQRSLERNDFYV